MNWINIYTKKTPMIENDSKMLHLSNFPNKEHFKKGNLDNWSIRRDYNTTQ